MRFLLLRSQRGFSLLELVLVVSLLSMLAAIAAPRVRTHLAAARDARRLSDVKSVKEALDRYYEEHLSYPVVAQSGPGGWDVSYDGGFLPVLVQEGFLDRVPADPLNNSTYFYSYYLYPDDAYGCISSGPFYVLGIRNFETADMAAKNAGYFQCSGRNWNLEFAYVTGGGASGH